MTDPASPSRPRRADAARNRGRLLQAARDALADHEEPGVALEEIARRAGVGIGTLYRHFPTREALVAAIYRDELDALCASGVRLLSEHPPEVALRAWIERFRAYVTVKRDMGESLRSVFAAGTFNLPEIRAEMADAIRPILLAGAREGSLRSDILAEDVVAAIVGMFAATSLTGGPQQLERILALVVDALVAHPAQKPGGRD